MKTPVTKYAKLIVGHKLISLVSVVIAGGAVAVSIYSISSSHNNRSMTLVSHTNNRSTTLVSHTNNMSVVLGDKASKSLRSTTNVNKVPSGQTSTKTPNAQTSNQANNVAGSASNAISSSSAISASSGSSINTTSVPSTTLVNDYPAKWATPSPDTVIDSWGMYNRESVSYAAWKVNETFGNMPSWGYQGNCVVQVPTSDGPSTPYTDPAGDAACWPSDANNSGFSVSNVPKEHSVGIYTSISSKTGFSAWIESTNGTSVTYSTYNCDGTWTFCTKTVNAAYFNAGYIYF